MALTPDWANKVIYSDASILDLPAHHLELRDLEASEQGMLHDDICQWQSLTLRGGATLPQIDYINGYVLEFIGPGPFTISGNLNCVIRKTGVQVERETSSSFATTAVGGSGPSAESIAAATRDAVLAALNEATIPVNAVSGNWPTAEENANAGWAHPFVSKLLTLKRFVSLSK